MNPQIFREYDIRGIVGQDLTSENVELIGKAIGTYIRRDGGKTLTLGWDVRASSVEFREIVTRALNSTGCDVIDIGCVPTPVAYFSLHHLKSDGGVMITGSHNPPEFNGFKISHGLHSLYGDKIQILKGLIDKNDFETGEGTSSTIDILEAYMDTICKVIDIPRKLKVVVDGGNGCFGITGPQLLRKLELDPIEQFCEPDGNFPNHHPDPTVPEYMQDLIDRVRSEKADLGIGFDGDADRLGVVDDKGNLLWGDQLLILFARSILKKHPGTAVVGEVKCSQNLYDDIKKQGGVPVMSAAGHSLIKKKMRETGALLAGEMSGHMCFKDNYYGFDDAIFAACRVLEIDLGDHRIIPGADRIAGAHTRIGAGTFGEMDMRQRAGRGQEACGHILGIKPRLEGVAGQADILLLRGQGFATGHTKLPFDEVDAGHGLGDRVFDLQPRVHLHEPEPVGDAAPRSHRR